MSDIIGAVGILFLIGVFIVGVVAGCAFAVMTILAMFGVI